MPKQLIEIDVPEEWEFDGAYTVHAEGSEPDIHICLKRKAPKFIEVRAFYYQWPNGKRGYGVVERGIGPQPILTESRSDFVEWVDRDWRKIYI